MATIDFNFRPDADRSVCVFGDITDELVSQLTLRILELRKQGNSPITVLINSNGGVIRCMDHIYSLLVSKSVDQRRPRIITVATGNARSAAATLLALGDYAIAFPKATIHFHGVRYGEVEDVTMESARSMAAQLELTNRATALSLAEKATERLAFHYARLKNKFPEIRNTYGKPALFDVECFAYCLKQHLSGESNRIVSDALARWQVLRDLSEKIIQKVVVSGKKGVDFEAAVLRKIIIYEVTRNKRTGWGLDAKGISQIVSDYLLLRDYDTGRHIRLIDNLSRRFGDAFFEQAELTRLEELHKKGEIEGEEFKNIVSQRTHKTIKPFCYFATSIWQGLQIDENQLSPRHAYWLGAVDEIYDTNLPCIRQIAEAQDPQQPDLPKTS